MKSVPKLLRRFVGILLSGSLLLLVVNIVILVATATSMMSDRSNSYPWKTAQEAADNMQQTEQGYEMTQEMQNRLEAENIWAVYIDNNTGESVWHSDNLPDTVPLKYTVSAVSDLTRGYIDDCPTFTGKGENGLMILGYPKESFWKHMWPSWDYNFIARLPKNLLITLGINVFIILLIYVTANGRLLKSVKPITDGIQALPLGEPVVLKEKGLLSEISANINRTSEVLQSQKAQIKKKETARANWIAGVSHDIRTPLSMVMGYAGQLKEDEGLTDEQRQKAAVIVKQSERMKNLISDLNLASKMEYNMQPVNMSGQNMVSIVRQVVVDFMNMDIDDKYPIMWETDEDFTVCVVNADKDLMKRAVGNLIQNCINHNENGCSVFVSVKAEKKNCVVCVEDNGKGAVDEQIEKLNNTPHYMVCDSSNTKEQRHGLGLLIVKQIAASHGGTVIIGHSGHGGFAVRIRMPISEGSQSPI